MTNYLLSTAYLPPLSYYAILNANPSVSIEFFEHFEKQTFRNRCHIYSPNGRQSLVVPLIKRSERTPTKEVKISYTEAWQKQHWRSIEAAYRRSPYFEYFEDHFAPIYSSPKHTYLIDLNMELLALVNRLFKITCQLIPTAHYEAFPPNILDYRKVFNPEPIALTLDTYPIYAQVFDLKYGFIPELSVLDLLFNEGPKGIDVLNKLFTTS